MAPGSDESAVRRLAKLSQLNWEPLDHPGVIRQLHEGERYFMTTRGVCDCGTEIGVSARIRTTLPDRAPDLSREIQKLKKRGWSDAKVDRWVGQAMADSAKKHNEAADRLTGPHPEVARWIQFVTAVLTGKHADWIGILLHWYEGNVSTEAIAQGNRRWLSLAELTEGYLLHAEEDTLHTVTLNARRS